MTRLGKIAIGGSLAIVAIAAGLATVRPGGRAESLLVHAGAGIRPPLDELGTAFEKETGIRVDYSYKGSGCLLADICFSKRGDLYIPGELFYIEQARKRGFITGERVAAQMATVLIVQKGNPKAIRGLRDLGRPGLRVGLGDPSAVAAGRAANQCLVKAGMLKQVEKNVVMSALNVVELGIGVKLRHLDAAIVWEATAHLFKKQVEILPLPEKWRVECPIPVAVLKFSRHPKEARQFMSFLASKAAARVFLKHGYGAVSSRHGGGAEAKS
jgi:molybdate transport system substrate-binding protein